tara:strand:- start:851 stop:1054 length:204 start_codon:yes stop_codon:yes gene_type:complete
MGRAIDMENAIDQLGRELEGLKKTLNDILEAVGDKKKSPEKPKKKSKTVMEKQKEASNKKNPQGITD